MDGVLPLFWLTNDVKMKPGQELTIKLNGVLDTVLYITYAIHFVLVAI